MRKWAFRGFLLAGILLRWVLPLAAQPARANAVVSIGMTVGDMDRSLDFYTHVLGFVPASDLEVSGAEYEQLTGVFGVRMRVVTLRLGAESLVLTQYLAPEGKPFPADSRGNDRWFQHIAIVVRNMDSAYALLRRAHVRHASTGPQLLPLSNPNAGGIRAFYFKDPDGHFLEAIWFPQGKGDPRWQSAPGELFLGIDHTAVVVENTERSLRFYRDLLGFRVAGESRNLGVEQAHLNNVEGASLRITGLRLASGPGVEFLEYLSPVTGRPFPPDAQANDQIHWQTTIELAAPEAFAALCTGGVRLVSRKVTSLPQGTLGFSQGLVVRDPDGHALQLIRRTTTP